MAWYKTSPLLREHTDRAAFEEGMARLETNVGHPVSAELELSQVYEAYATYPDSIVLLYRVTFSKGEASHVTMRMHQMDDVWLVMGFFNQQYVELPTL